MTSYVACRGAAGLPSIAPKGIMSVNGCIEYSPEQSEDVRASREARPAEGARQAGISKNKTLHGVGAGGVHSTAPTKSNGQVTEKRVNTIKAFRARAVTLSAEAAELVEARHRVRGMW